MDSPLVAQEKEAKMKHNDYVIPDDVLQREFDKLSGGFSSYHFAKCLKAAGVQFHQSKIASMFLQRMKRKGLVVWGVGAWSKPANTNSPDAPDSMPIEG